MAKANAQTQPTTSTPAPEPTNTAAAIEAQRPQTEWVAVRWMRVSDRETLAPSPITIEETRSREYKGPRYAVRRGNSCLNKAGDWEYEPIPSARGALFLRRCRFETFEKAQAAAVNARG